MPSAGDLFGKESTAYQMFVWQVVAQVISALAAPGFTELQTLVNETAPVSPLSAADAATAANRSFLPAEAAATEAARQGINSARFAVLRHLAGDAPAPQQLATALRRGVIPKDGTGPDATSFTQGIAEGNLLDKWGPVIESIARQVPSPADIVNAIVRGQVTPAEGQALYDKVGGDTAYLQLQVDINGRPPAPTQLLELAMRGIIPWQGTGAGATTFQQGIYEGDSKDKWEPVYRNLADWFPTVSEAVELYRWGEIDQGQAVQLMTTRGLTAEQASWWIEYAHQNAVNEFRGLTEQAVLAQVSVGYMSDAQATTALEALHRGPEAISELLSYAHLQRALRAVDTAVSRVGSLYTTRKITQAAATDALSRLGVESRAVADIIADWTAVAGVNVKTLTESQVADAWDYGVITESEALGELQNIGYSPYDAWIVLSVKNKGPLPGQPPPVIGAPPGVVTPGTT